MLQHVERWLETNLPLIGQTMEEARLSRIKNTKQDPLHPHAIYDPKYRYLSEMPICGAMQNMPLPSGFNAITDGVIFYPEIDTTTGQFRLGVSEHIFARRDDQILCLTPGQFIKYLARLEPGPGVRIEALQTRAPRLVIANEGMKGIIALLGTPKEIFEALHWEYLTGNEREHYWSDREKILKSYHERFDRPEFKMPHRISVRH